jgi:hypothetical protein
MQLTLRSLTVLSPDEVALTVADDAGVEVTFRFTGAQIDGRIVGASGELEFCARYRCVPGPALPMWPEQLAIAALRAVRDPLPDAGTAAVLNAQVREELARRWRPAASGLTTRDSRNRGWPCGPTAPGRCGIGGYDAHDKA